MTKCPLDIAAVASTRKDTESAATRRLIARRLSFDALALRDRAAWGRATDAESLRRVVLDVKREIAWSDFDRFAEWVIETHGAGLARAVGLVNGPPRLTISA
jgi:hypothetical protein